MSACVLTLWAKIKMGSKPNNDWYFEYLDRISNLEFKSKPSMQGGTALRYQAAREAQGNRALCGQIAQAIVPRLAGSTVLLMTGTGNPVWLAQGETDGPSGVAVLTRIFSNLGVRTVVLSENRFLPGIQAAIQAGGSPLLSEEAWQERNNGTLLLAFPEGAAAAPQFVEQLINRIHGISAAFFIEKPGPNAIGIFHNSSGKPKDSDWVAHAHVLNNELRKLGILTVGVGDGGNEIGFGRIRDHLLESHPYGRDCGCPCHGGLLDSTVVDFQLPASVSNWGGYAIAGAIAIELSRFNLMPTWSEVSLTIIAPTTEGAFDGYSGQPTATADGTSLEANQAIYALMLEALRMAQESRQGPLK
jgi:hypothetical protein